MSSPISLAIASGDGIGPEIMPEALKALDVVSAQCGLTIKKTEFDLGWRLYDRTGEILPEKVIDELQLEELLVHNHKHQTEVVGQPPLHHIVFAVEVLVGRPLLYQPLLDQFVQHVELQLAECHLEEKHAAGREHARHVNHN